MLPVPAPWQAPQSVRRENDGEQRGHAEREQRKDEKEASTGMGDAARQADTLTLHMDDGDAHRKERQDEDDDVPRSASCEDQRSEQPKDTDGHSSEVRKPSLFEPADDVVCQVSRKEEDREQGHDC